VFPEHLTDLFTSLNELILKKTNVKDSYSLADLKGLGKDIWQKHDVDAYISKERESWD
jgi:hypothetical protein